MTLMNIGLSKEIKTLNRKSTPKLVSQLTGSMAILAALSACSKPVDTGSGPFEIKGFHVDMGRQQFLEKLSTLEGVCSYKTAYGAPEWDCKLSENALTVAGIPVQSVFASPISEENADTDGPLDQIGIILTQGNGRHYESTVTTLSESFGTAQPQTHPRVTSWKKGAYTLDVKQKSRIFITQSVDRQAQQQDI